MRIVSVIRQRMPLYTFIIALALVFAACGNTGGTGSGNGPTAGPSPTQPPTTVKGYGTSHGCPSDVVVNNAPPSANVIVQTSNINGPVTVHSGDIVEVRLPFEHKWSGPTTSQGGLELQSPSGYAWKADSVCVWRFVAKAPGTTELKFSSQALCKAGEMCPQFIMSVPFEITVK